MKDAIQALAEHLGYGTALGDTETFGYGGGLLLDERQCRDLLYLLTDDKQWLA